MFKQKEEFQAEELAEQLLAVSDQAFEHGSPWNAAQFAADILNERSYYLLYEVNQQVIGYLTIHLVLDEAEVINIAVLPAFKGRKVALALFEEGLDFLRQQGVTALFLDVREQNLPALALYANVGFKEISRRKQYYHQPQEDGIVMCLEIK